MKRRHAVAIAAVAAAAAALIMLLRVLPGLLVDYWWFDALRQAGVFRRVLVAKVLLWVVGFGVAGGGCASGFLIARRISGPMLWAEQRWGGFQVPLVAAHRLIYGLCWAGAAAVGLAGGAALASSWHRVLLFLNRVPFGVADPIFGNDVGFYVFVLPLLVILRRMLLALVWTSFAGAAAWYAATGVFAAANLSLVPGRVFAHLSRTIGAAFVLIAAGRFLGRYGLLYSRQGASFGAGYADLHARLPAQWLMIVVSLAVAAAFFRAASPAKVRSLLVSLGVWMGCMVVADGLAPSLLQALVVTPNELRLEEPYIQNTIDATLRAYGLDAVEEVEYPVIEELNYDKVVADTMTMSNVRLWDWRPLRDTYQQIQAIRSYYDFNDVDVDRYDLERGPTEVLLSVRELNPAKLTPEAQTWVNLRLKYTHGYGLCMSPANAQTEEGLPVLTIKDLPPVTPQGIRLDQPQVYYGESTSEPVFVNTGEEEFDYPVGRSNAWTRYGGKGGVRMDSLWRKLLFAIELGDPKVLLSGELPAGSRVMYRRRVTERISRLAPYLLLDRDPYPVIYDGRIVWIQDAYTHTALYPYSDPTGGSDLNYIRNSVKVVVDAYDGAVSFYVADQADPLIRAYQRMFPGLYKPMGEMPDALRRHVRYPVDLFDIQVAKYSVFHMRTARVLYAQEDPWDVALEKYGGREQRVESYYVLMRLPKGERAEFLLMLPFTPKGRKNMVAWLAGRCDGENYGKLVAYVFPKGKNVAGPLQIEDYIDQDPGISQQLTLWNQGGSDVVRGNLLVIPIAGGLLYVEPLYIRAEAGGIPQLKRVITATASQDIAAAGRRVAMAPTLAESLRKLFGEEPLQPGQAAPSVRAGPLLDAASLARAALQRALDRYEQAQQALRDADWAGYGRRMKQMREALDELARALPPQDKPQP